MILMGSGIESCRAEQPFSLANIHISKGRPDDRLVFTSVLGDLPGGLAQRTPRCRPFLGRHCHRSGSQRIQRPRKDILGHPSINNAEAKMVALCRATL